MIDEERWMQVDVDADAARRIRVVARAALAEAVADERSTGLAAAERWWSERLEPTVVAFVAFGQLAAAVLVVFAG